MLIQIFWLLYSLDVHINLKGYNNLPILQIRRYIKHEKVYETFYLNLPKKVVSFLNWQQGDKIELKIIEKSVLLFKSLE